MNYHIKHESYFYISGNFVGTINNKVLKETNSIMHSQKCFLNLPQPSAIEIRILNFK